MSRKLTASRAPIEYMIHELLKNAIQASLLYQYIPKIKIRIDDRRDGIRVRIDDNAGGIPDCLDPFSFGATTAIDTDRVLAGYGLGLPISRLYAQFFEGDLRLKKIENGTSAQIILPEFRESSVIRSHMQHELLYQEYIA